MSKTGRIPYLIVLTGALFFFTSLSPGMNRNLFENITLSPGLGFSHFNRTVTSGENSQSSALKSYLFTAEMNFHFENGLTLKPFFGYAFSNYDSLIFRQLPISVELETGNLSGIVIGGEISKSLYSMGNFETGLKGLFTANLSKNNQWEIPGLAVSGTVEGKPSWMEAKLGPFFKYHGLEGFSPIVFLAYSPLWGNFTLDESIENLTGTEKKELKGKGNLLISLGAELYLHPSFQAVVEIFIFPHEEKVDTGLSIRTQYYF